MAKAVKRTYVSAKREEQAKTTRWSILQAAGKLFVARGYGATSIQAIADEAGVAVQTVYAVFGNKRELLRQAIDVAIVGDDEALSVTDRPDALAIKTEPDARRRAQMGAAICRAVSERMTPIVMVAREAAASDPEVAAMYAALIAGLPASMAESAKLLAGPDGLRVSMQQAAATLFVLYSPHVASLLTDDLGWPWDKYEKWLADMLLHAVMRS